MEYLNRLVGLDSTTYPNGTYPWMSIKAGSDCIFSGESITFTDPTGTVQFFGNVLDKDGNPITGGAGGGFDPSLNRTITGDWAFTGGFAVSNPSDSNLQLTQNGAGAIQLVATGSGGVIDLQCNATMSLYSNNNIQITSQGDISLNTPGATDVIVSQSTGKFAVNQKSGVVNIFECRDNTFAGTDLSNYETLMTDRSFATKKYVDSQVVASAETIQILNLAGASRVYTSSGNPVPGTFTLDQKIGTNNNITFEPPNTIRIRNSTNKRFKFTYNLTFQPNVGTTLPEEGLNFNISILRITPTIDEFALTTNSLNSKISIQSFECVRIYKCIGDDETFQLFGSDQDNSGKNMNTADIVFIVEQLEP